ncbi:chitin synthesis regulation, resistance to congo red-domain-containing protein [Xylariales sp. AK1849]|nr:chitin synthesis regulation, resistance to congo red-domain-containing protein [Xylariales sp. AK1849]
MAPTDFSSLLSKRYCSSYNSYGDCNNTSAWGYYGRWIFAGVVIIVVLAIFFLWACINSRRRRRGGMRPMYGTGWMASGPGQNQNNPQAYNQGYNNAPPAYGAQGQSYPMQNQHTGNTFNQNDGYYAGGQREGVQQPKNVYGNGNDYAPPEGPPPAKTSH